MRNSKKYFVIILAILLVVVMAFTLTCCNKKKQEQQKKQEDGVSITAVEDFVTQDDNTLKCEVDNTIEKYSLKGKFSFKGGAEVKYYDTPDGETIGNEIKNLNITLKEGDNIIFVEVKNNGVTKIHRVNIYRKMHFTVTFDTPQREIDSQTVLEGDCAVKPVLEPTQIGYIFDGWDFDFAQPITSNITIKSLWTAREYVITYDANGGVILDENGVEIEDYTQKVHYGENVKFYVPYKEGYQFQGWYVDNSRQQDGVWNGLGDKTFKAKWAILSLDVKITPSLVGAADIVGEGDYDYNTTCTITISPYNGYRFLGLYKDDELITTDTTYEITLKENNIRLNARFKTVREDMEPFLFDTDDEVSYVIKGVRHTSATDITIPDCVVGIRENSFSVNALRTLTIPFIGTSENDAKNCKALSSMFASSIPETLTSVHVTGECYVDQNTFNGARNVTSLIFDDVRKIGAQAFIYNQYLTELKVSDSIEYVGEYIFYDRSMYPYYDYTLVNFNAFNEYGNGLYLGNDENPYAVFYKEKVENQSTCDINANTKAIASRAFNYRANYSSNSLSVTLPANLNSVGDYAFYRRTMSSVNIPTSLKYIGNNAFYEAISGGTMNITFGNKLETIGDSAFRGCNSIKSVVLPDSLTSLGSSAFAYCSYLSSVTIGKGLEEIKGYTFENIKISSMTIPDNVEKIGDYAFNNCSSLTSVTIGKGLKNVTSYAFRNSSYLATIAISNENENLYGENCIIERATDKLIFGASNAVLPVGLKEIGDYAFYCGRITSIVIPATVTKIKQNAFYSCDSLSSVTFAAGSGLKEIEYYAFYDCDILPSIALPDGIEKIGDYAFSYCDLLKTVSLPDSLKYVGNNVFYHYSGIVEYTIVDNVKYLGNADNLYVYVSGLSNNSVSTVTLQEGVKCIDMNAFNGCNNVTSLTIPNEENVDLSFLKNASFTTVTEGNVKYRGTTTNPYYYVSGSNSSYSSYTIQVGAKIIGDSAFYNRTMTSVTIPSSVEEIGNNAFQYCYSLSTVRFESGSKLKKIGIRAFYNCYSSSFTSITIPASVEEIGSEAFYYCQYLNNIYFASGSKLKKIGSYAFCYCGYYYNYGTNSVTIPASVEEIGDHAFYYCNRMNISFASGSQLKKIGSYAFYDCDQIYNITIPASVEEIGQQAFYSCNNLYQLTFENGSQLKTMGSNAFANCSNLHNLTLASGMETIGDYAFAWCYYLGNVTIPGSVKKIGNDAFNNCYRNMYSVTIEEGVEEIGEYAFCSCYDSLTTINIPVSVKSFGRYMLASCEELETINYAGTIAQWNEIKKDEYWGRTYERFTVYCSDGNIRYRGD